MFATLFEQLVKCIPRIRRLSGRSPSVSPSVPEKLDNKLIQCDSATSYAKRGDVLREAKRRS